MTSPRKDDGAPRSVLGMSGTYVGPGHRAGCRHAALRGHPPTGSYRPVPCPACGDFFVVRVVEIVGDCTPRPKPYWATQLVPSNARGWICGDDFTLEPPLSAAEAAVR